MDRRAVRLFCRGGSRARGRGHLRRHVVRRRAAHARDRSAHGARRGARTRAASSAAEGMTTAAIGTLIGSIGAYYVVSAMRSLVYAVDTVAPTAFVAVAVTLLGAALLACVVPARRAGGVRLSRWRRSARNRPAFPRGCCRSYRVRRRSTHSPASGEAARRTAAGRVGR